MIQCCQEIAQMKQSDSAKSYFKSSLNYNDMLQYLGTLWILLTNLFDLDLPILMDKRIICVIVLLSQAVKAILDWIRLFDSTSFYAIL